MLRIVILVDKLVITNVITKRILFIFVDFKTVNFVVFLKTNIVNVKRWRHLIPDHFQHLNNLPEYNQPSI